MSADRSVLEEFRAALSLLVGVECWSVIAGVPTGPVIHLDLGKRVPLAKELKNENLRDDQRRFEGEFVLLIECVWRLDSDRSVICGAWDDNSSEGPMLRGLEQLEGDVIGSVDLIEPGLDLVLRFRRERTLRIFCDQVNEVDERDNYTLFTPAREFTVGWRSVLRAQASK